MKGQLHDIAILIDFYQLIEATINALPFVVNLNSLVEIVKYYLVAIVPRKETKAKRKAQDCAKAVTIAVAVWELFSILYLHFIMNVEY